MAREIISISVCFPLLSPNIRVSRLTRHRADRPSKVTSPLANIAGFLLTTLGIGRQPSRRKLLEDRSQGTRPWR